MSVRREFDVENAEERNLRFSREERDHIADHALDSIYGLAGLLRETIDNARVDPSSHARKIAALSNLLSDIGWEREVQGEHPIPNCWFLGELFPAAQLRPWLEEWQRQDNEVLANAERAVEVAELQKATKGTDFPYNEGVARKRVADAQTKLGTGAIFLARIEKWMASHGN